jgi:putative ABC transport system substrate-binding protein
VTATPVVGSLHAASLSGFEVHMAEFRRGLREEKYTEAENLVIEYRWADGVFERLPHLMAELVQLRVAVIAAWGTAARAAAQAHAAGIGREIPIVFATGGDPVALKLVASLNRPGGNITGITSMATELGPKRLELARELVQTATTVALLTNPSSPSSEPEREELEKAARALGWRLHVLHASTIGEFETAFETLVHEPIQALIISVDTFYYGEMTRLASLAARYRVPTIGPVREFAASGGLMSFGANIPDLYRHAGIYVGRILRGTKAADLPVLQPTKFELVINLKTAKALDLDVPPTLLARADEVIE